MPCYTPNQGYFVPMRTKSGVVSRVVKITKSLNTLFRAGYDVKAICASDGREHVSVPCQSCFDCRMNYSRQWAIRCMHEISLHEENCFITLTYHPDFLPKDGSLVHRDFQLFMKRLRRGLGSGIRFFMCGEYGDAKGRPHYHAILFGLDFPDKKFWKMQKGFPLYISDMLSHFWLLGNCSVGSACFKTAAYVSRYILKKITGDAAKDHYKGKQPEYAKMSNQAGIGREWYEKYKKNVYQLDEILVRGSVCKPPKYYDSCFKKEFPLDFEIVQEKRIECAQKKAVDNSHSRLMVRRQVARAKFIPYPRSVV